MDETMQVQGEAVAKVEKPKDYKMTIKVIDGETEKASAAIEAVSRISAEDRSRRWFRKQGVDMALVHKGRTADEIVWTGYVTGIPEGLVPAKPPKPPRAPKVSKNTPEAVFGKVIPALGDIYVRWQEAKGQDGVTWAPFEKEGKRALAKAKAKMTHFTNRPFELAFSVKGQAAKIGRNSSGGFKLIVAAPPEPEQTTEEQEA